MSLSMNIPSKNPLSLSSLRHLTPQLTLAFWTTFEWKIEAISSWRTDAFGTCQFILLFFQKCYILELISHLWRSIALLSILMWMWFLIHCWLIWGKVFQFHEGHGTWVLGQFIQSFNLWFGWADRWVGRTNFQCFT